MMGEWTITAVDPDVMAEGTVAVVHGTRVEAGGRVLFPLYHPAAALRSTKVRTVFFEDAQKLAAAL